MRDILISLLTLLPVLLGGCMSRTEIDFDRDGGSGFVTAPNGLVIVNEGNFQYGNATLSYYDPDTRTVSHELFYRVNGMRLGDVAQSMTAHKGLGWIVVNNSHVIFAVDLTTLREKGRIINLTSPRYIHFVSDTKAYVTQLWDNNIYIVNPLTYSVTGFITIDGMNQQSGSTEQMVQIGKYLYVSCWSYQRNVLKIDTETDEIVARLDVGMQPRALVKDFRGRLWTITDGGYKGSPTGWEQPSLVCIDPSEMKILSRFLFPENSTPRQLITDSTGSKLYFINDDLYEMDADASMLPSTPLVSSQGRLFYSMTIDPTRGDIYVSDAIDYTQQGVIFRYTPAGKQIDKFYAGIIPASFCWIP